MEQSVPKRRHTKFRRRGITQKKAYNIHNTAKVWNQRDFSCSVDLLGILPLSAAASLGKLYWRIYCHLRNSLTKKTKFPPNCYKTSLNFSVFSVLYTMPLFLLLKLHFFIPFITPFDTDILSSCCRFGDNPRETPLLSISALGPAS
jgi:hypothetical protein